jgi:hypothetical protein
MSRPIHDPEAVARYRDELAPVEPLEVPEVAPEARPCPAPVRPGSHNAAAAYRLGCEDEWADRMKAKYGGEW